MSSVVDVHKKNGITPHFDVYIGRKVRFVDWTWDSKWGNPRLILKEYELYIKHSIKETPEYFNLDRLKGKKLGCWCITTDKLEPLKCHGQVLMKLIKEKFK